MKPKDLSETSKRTLFRQAVLFSHYLLLPTMFKLKILLDLKMCKQVFFAEMCPEPSLNIFHQILYFSMGGDTSMAGMAIAIPGI